MRLLLLPLALMLSGCVIDYSDETLIEFDACDTFQDLCGELDTYRVRARELQQEATAPIDERVRFRDLRPNQLITFELEGYAGAELLYTATCEIGAVPYSTTVADCRNHVSTAVPW